MSADGVAGPKKQPQFLGAGAPATAVDLNLIANYAALVGNRKVGTTTERTAAGVAGEVWEGLRWKDTTLGAEFEYLSGAWVNVDAPIFDVITFTGIYSAGSPTPRLGLQNGQYFLDGVIASSSAAFAALTSYTIGTIPSTKAPIANRTFPIFANNAFGWLGIDTAGSIQVALSAGFTAPLNAHINGIFWPDKNL